MTDQTLQAAREAVELMGGATEGARKLSAFLGQEIARTRVQNWCRYGVAGRFVLAVEAVSGVPRHRLAPELYPLGATAPAKSLRKRA